MVAKWRSPVDGVAGLGGLTVEAYYGSGLVFRFRISVRARVRVKYVD